MLRLILLCLVIVSTYHAFGQKSVRGYVDDNSTQYRWLSEYRSFLSIPNVLGDSANIHKNALAIAEMMNSRGIKSRLLYSGKTGSAPAVYGEVTTPGAKITLALYAHYDGQPVNPKQWAEGLSPFTPVLMNKRLDNGGIIIPFPRPEEKISADWRLYAQLGR